MINLIPPHGIRIVHKEYLFRVLTVWAYACIVACIGGAIALVPTYVLFTKQLQTDTTTSLGNAESIDEEYAATQKTLEGATAVSQQLARNVPHAHASTVIRRMEAAATTDITLEGISVVRENTSTAVTAHGVAETREALRKFVETLGRDAYFADARVPVSSFAKDTNLPFTISSTVREAQK